MNAAHLAALYDADSALHARLVPEPQAWMLMMDALALLAVVCRRSFKQVGRQSTRR
jgi:hypothetical protein